MDAAEVEGNLNNRAWPVFSKRSSMTATISFRLSESLRSQLEYEARKREIGLCSLIRQILSDHVNEIRTSSKQDVMNLIRKYENEYYRQ
jgi:predicted HicB family RNase H-like nuclease